MVLSVENDKNVHFAMILAFLEAKIFDQFCKKYCKVIKFLEALKFQKFQNLQKYSIIIKFFFCEIIGPTRI